MRIAYTTDELLVMMALISFLGFLLENAWLIVTKGFFDNRNVHTPFLFGYGVTVIGIYLLFGTPQQMSILGIYDVSRHAELCYYFACFVLVCLGEPAMGNFVEKHFHFEYWNYEWIPMHIGKYTSVPTSLGFAAIIACFMDKAFPLLMDGISRADDELTHSWGIGLFVLMVLDTVLSFAKMHKKQGVNTRWRMVLRGGEEKPGLVLTVR